MAAWFMAASIALMTAFCAWVLAGIARMLADEIARSKEKGGTMSDREPYIMCNGSPVSLGITFALFGDEHDDVLVLTTVGEIRDVYMTGSIDGYNEDWLGSEDHPVIGTVLR